MKKIIIIVIVLLVAGGVLYKTVIKPKPAVAPQSAGSGASQNSTPTDMKIESSAFGPNGDIPVKFTCDGDNINPPLKFSGVPQNTQSLVLIMDDPDAPTGTWVHWILWNIPSNVVEIAEKSVPAGAVQGATSSGQNSYGGPCPPSGTHRYFFKVYALDAKLSIPSYSDKAALEKAMEGHVINQAQLVGLYKRK